MISKSQWSARSSILATSPSYWLFTLCKTLGVMSSLFLVSHWISIHLLKLVGCPDALLCENTFDSVLKKVADKVDLKLVYIAQLVPFPVFLMPCLWSETRLNSSDEDFGATCMHGPEECAGNVHQLCAQKHSPLANWWEFVNCNNYQGVSQWSLSDWILVK